MGNAHETERAAGHRQRQLAVFNEGESNPMRSLFRRLATLTAATALGAANLLPQPAAAQTAPACSFQNGFAVMAQSLSSDVIGSCRENEHFNAMNGNVEQLTTNGLLFWRKCDNATVFTDGYITWLNGPLGLQNRLSAGPIFDWEPINSCAPEPPTPVVPPQPSVPTTPPPAPPSVPAAPQVILPVMPTAAPCPDKITIIRNLDLTALDRRGVNYMCVDGYHARLASTDFSGATLTQAYLDTSELTHANFANAKLTLARMVSVFAQSAKVNPGPVFVAADMRGAKVAGSKLLYSDFRYADMSNADLSRAQLNGSDLRGADLRGADLSQTNFTDANLTGAYLCGANTTGAVFLRAVGVSTSCG
jgi:Pentapeptide repeats (8 copies)